MGSAESDYKYKNWVFTWNSASAVDDELPDTGMLDSYLEEITTLFVYQPEGGEKCNRTHFQGCFRTKCRIRKKTLLNKFSDKFGSHLVLYLTIDRMYGTWDEAYEYATKLETRREGSRVHTTPGQNKYEGKDIKFLDDRQKWFKWQNKLFNKIFSSDSISIQDADDRSIMWFACERGNTGKSKFSKWLSYRHNNIIQLPFGTATQLRSSVIAAGPRKVYILDVPRTLGREDSIHDFISVLEQIKNGFIQSSMYGKYESLSFDPPHVVVFANFEPEIKLLSRDRWNIYRVSSYDHDIARLDLSTGNTYYAD